MTTPHDPTVMAVITLRDIYDRQLQQETATTQAIVDLKQQIAAMSSHINAYVQHREDVTKIHDDFERRFRVLERWKAAIPPSLFAATVSLIVALIEYTTRAVGHG